MVLFLGGVFPKVSGCNNNVNSRWPFNCEYVGMIRNSVPSGLGVMRMPDVHGVVSGSGNVYMGALLDGLKHGFGT